MLLAIDVGNTNIVFGIFKEKHLVAKFRMSTLHGSSADEIGLLIVQFCRNFNFDIRAIDSIAVCSVVPQVMYTLRHALDKYIGCPIYVAGEDLEISLGSYCKEPLGVDRAVTGVAAKALYGTPVIVIDFGTATKFDAFCEDGYYLGGLICPGISISMDALFAKAAALPRIEIKKPRRVIGLNTVEQMQAGAVYGFVGSVEGVVAGMKREMGIEELPVVATGGLAKLISDHTPVIEHVDRNLTLHGLQIIMESMEDIT